jgi:hypothetical protein
MKAIRGQFGEARFSAVALERENRDVTNHVFQSRIAPPAIFSWKQAASAALIIASFAAPFRAQKAPTSGGGGAVHTPSHGPVVGTTSPGIYNGPSVGPMWQPFPDIPPIPKPTALEDEKCLPWNVSDLRATTVSVTRLTIPSKASHEYEKACAANNNKKFDEAEMHARQAIDKFQNYAAALVLLGVILEEQNKVQDAQDSCAHAMTADPTFLAGYLCAAELSTRNQQWEEVLNLSKIAFGLNSAGDGYLYYYRALAYFRMNDLAEAKKSALQSAEIDVKRNEVPLYFLTAQIYAAEGDKADAADQLRQVLKRHASGEQENAAKQLLAKLESPQDAK